MLEVIESEQYRMMSNSDLLAVVLGKDKKEVEKSADMLFETKPLYCSAGELAEKADISSYNAKKVLALAELMKRNPVAKKNAVIDNPNSVFDYVKEDFLGLDHEELFVIFLNNANHVIKKVRFSVGSYDSTVFDVRQIMRVALDVKATAMIMVHNHPSGSIQPSKEDDNITSKLMVAGKCLDIDLMDHLIVSDGKFFSYKSEKKI